MTILKTGIIGTYRKKDEKRVPIHPDHFQDIPPEIRSYLLFEEGYGEPFGVSDREIAAFMGYESLSCSGLWLPAIKILTTGERRSPQLLPHPV